MTLSPDDEPTTPIEYGWMRFGIGLAIANLVYLAIVAYALQIDVWLGIGVGVLGAVVGVAVVAVVVFGPIDISRS